ncbi:MAG: PspC domain-containing protein [Deltaproteobacteria bacterium]|nr:PspC domain-containing protein [Deltaproteobacteria bacterium]MBW2413319.1 PspC domain-containing protein [Deltaproteobacteria bacterium]
MAFPIYEDSRSLLQRPLRRPRHPRLIGGVCAGLGRWLGWDRAVVRLAFAILALATSLVPAVVLYGVLWLAIPEASDPRYALYDLDEF